MTTIDHFTKNSSLEYHDYMSSALPYHVHDSPQYGLILASATGAQILHDLGARQLEVLTNNPKKLSGLQGYGLEVARQVPLRIAPNPHNEKYLQTKRDKMGHLLGQPGEVAGRN